MNKRHQRPGQERNINSGKRSKLTTKRVITWIAIILIFLLLFWLCVAENINSWSEWGNP